ncbi:MAG TPA: bifunctional indole-3-glycerol phosphate synthase/phosphoribosylanthranilate isomerase [Spirochaetia bacterium]|nr:bifunctional indole-3-glycerol phosphate synthase/phosphoribosylanthranilate isomerase [Spirochaetia bacterium]
MSIRDEIVENRRNRIARHGHSLGVHIPAQRNVPLVPFGQKPFLIAEVKRRSPSRGGIAPDVDPVEQVKLYRTHGVRNVSVLTEEDYFEGSLDDLLAVKTACPDLAILRKDFILDPEDIDVSFRAGADAVLLIAAILPDERLVMLAREAERYGLSVLLEVHDEADVAKARRIAPPLVGINARNLETFTIDPAAPLKLRRLIGWPARLVYESGIFSREDALVALSAGFSGLLVGEAVMRNPALGGELIDAFDWSGNDFWGKLYLREKGDGRPLVKVCGITNLEDAQAALDEGADVLGFVLADSPRHVTAAQLERFQRIDALKVGVVVAGHEAVIDSDIACLLERGIIHAVQFHGEEEPEYCCKAAFPYYKAIRAGTEADVQRIDHYRSVRVLVDAFQEGQPGGTGTVVAADLIEHARAKKPLWLAGGIGPGNVGEIISRFCPELIDASSRLERKPGKKDPKALRAFFKEIERASALS